MAAQACLFIDGSNFYHAARDIGIATGDLDYNALAYKLILDRRLTAIRYYVGKVSGDIPRTISQGKFLDSIRAQGINVVLGRIERRMLHPDRNPLITRLKNLIAAATQEIRKAARPALSRRSTMTTTHCPGAGSRCCNPMPTA